MNSFSSKLWYNKNSILKSGEVSLYLQVVIDGKHKEYPLKLKWQVDKVDLALGVLLPRRRKDPEVADYNLLIMMEQSKHTEIARNYRIRAITLDIRQFHKEVKVFNLNESFVSFMYRETDARYRRKEIAYRTKQNHDACNALMIKFDKQWQFKYVNEAWMKKFKQFLIQQEYKAGHVWTTLKTVKAYLHLAAESPMLYVDPKAAAFSNPEPKWVNNYLDKDELRLLLKYYKSSEITEQQRLVLRAFLFTCYTSLRVSDVYRVNSSWRISDNTLHFLPKKNAKLQRWISVPITPLAKQFVKNTLGSYFELPSEQQYNRELKEIARKAGIKKEVTSHYGRHTFGYLHMVSSGSIRTLQVIMGHSKLETTQRYAHIDEDFKLASVLKIQDEFPDMLL